ncbi:MAG: lytic transglycosylase domain-containing protein, partial [Mesorhizobium sp.]
MPAKFLFPVLAAVLAVAALSGCTSTSPATPAPAFTENAANTDAGFTLALPDTVSVLPEPSGVAQT